MSNQFKMHIPNFSEAVKVPSITDHYKYIASLNAHITTSNVIKDQHSRCRSQESSYNQNQRKTSFSDVKRNDI